MFNQFQDENPPSPTHDQGHMSKKRCSDEDNDLCQSQNDYQTCQVDNSNAVITKIAKLYAERLMSDIILDINGQEFPAHRLILCASSDVFQVMLMNSSWIESKGTRIYLQESAECAEYFEHFLKYLYTGKLKLELTKVLHILTLADKYNVKDLVALCLEYMIEHIPAASFYHQLIHWYQYTTYCCHFNVAQACKNFIKWNFEMASKSEDFLHLDLDLLITILSEDDVVVFDEYSLFRIIDKWIDGQKVKYVEESCANIEERLLHIVKESMSYVRFPMMAPRQLAEMILSPLTQKYKELLEKMAIGMSFHKLGLVNSLKDLLRNDPDKSKLFTPRLYCTDKWSICLSVENFSTMNHYQSKTLVFSTPLSFSERSAEKTLEWVVDFYPKGVWFLKHYLIIWQGTVEVPEHIMQTTRLSIHCKNEDESDVKMQIGVLIAGYQDGVEHVRLVVRKNFFFSEQNKILNIDNLIPYEELTHSATHSFMRNNNSNTGGSGSARNSSVGNNSLVDKSPFLVGINRDSIRIRIVITPMNEYNF